nr:response regulator [Deltaproteobacteria bacterium]
NMCFEPTPLSILTADVAATFRSLIERAGLEIEVDCETFDELVYVDRQAWEQILLNLLSNAYKFTFEGKIAVSLRRDVEHVRLEVRDTGVGIDPAHLELVFDRFARVDGEKARSYDGSGIGLALVRELVKLHGGVIGASSKRGAGTTFTVRIPLGSAHLPAEHLAYRATNELDGADAFVRDAATWSSDRRSEQGGRGADRPRVLLVDDNRDMRAYLASLLQEDCIVHAVANGDDALDAARRNPPALIVADIMMPGLDGLALLRELRTEPLTKHIPVIILSARAADEARIDGLVAGADDYIVKPFCARELRARIRTQLELSRARLEIGEARAATRAKDDFLSLLGHELRNPLAVLSTTVQAMMLVAPSEQADLMERAVGDLSRFVDDLLDMSRLSRGKLQLSRERVELSAVLDRAMERVRVLVSERQTQVFLRAPRTGFLIDCDPERLAQAFANVLANAAKFSEPNARVTVDASHRGECARVVISDAGCGIEPERLATVFDAFEATGRTTGLGVGLAITRNLVELHLGTIEIRSEGAGRGTECVIELPLQAGEVSRPATSTRPRRRRVLLVEDNHDTAIALQHALQQLGYQVALAHNGPVALTVARSFQPDVALLDIGLPVMDGWELARRLRELKVPSRELHFVAVTARDQTEDKQKSADAGFAEHLVKPVDLAKLQRVVESLPEPSVH